MTTVMATLAFLTIVFGNWIYIADRANTPDSPRSYFLAKMPDVHKVFFEFKEYVALFPLPLSVAVFVWLGATALFQQSHCPRRQHPVSAHLPGCGLGRVCPVVLVPLAPRGCCLDFVGVRTVGGRTAHYQAMGERTGQRGGDHAFAGSHGRGWYDLGAPRAHVRHATHPGHGRGTVCCLPRPDRAEGRAFWRQAPKVIA
jgi:hypothetical protein